MSEADSRTTRDLAGAGFDHSQLTAVTTPHEQLIVLLLEALQRLADAGEDVACRIAGRACAVQGRSDARGRGRARPGARGMRAEHPIILQNMHLPYIFTPACRPPFAALDRQRCRDDSCD